MKEILKSNLDYVTIRFKEARAGCGLKNRLREFSFIFAYVIFMVFRIYLCEKNIPHRDCSEMGAISKYVSNIAFFILNILGKTLLFALNFDLKKTNSWNFEKLINDTCMGIVFILVRKKWGVTVEILKRGYLKLWKCVKWEEVWPKMFRK